MLTMGGDFMYQGAQKWYTNMDKLIKYVNQVNNSDKFGTLICNETVH